MTPESLAARIDHTLLDPAAGHAAVERACDEALAWGFATVCTHPVWVATCAKRLRGRRPGVCAVVGFPSGAHVADIKAAEAARAVADGATEVDVPLWLGAIRDGRHDLVRAEVIAVVVAARPARVKFILETDALEAAEQVAAARLAAEGGAAFVKTSTGTRGGATVEVVARLAQAVGPGVGVKASGGIRTLEQALALVAAGATRLGTSSGVAILREALAEAGGPAPMPPGQAR